MRKLHASPEAASLIALMVSILALVVSLYESYNNRKTARSSVRPVVRVSFEFNQDGLGWELINSGLGPAEIEWFEVYVDGNPVPSWMFVGRALGIKKGVGYTFILPAGGSYSAGETKKFFWLDPVKNEEEEKKIKENSGRIGFRFCYCSLQDECWLKESRKVQQESACKNSRSFSVLS